jgi:hypothetical protein
VDGHHLRLAFEGMDEADVKRTVREYDDALRHVLGVRRAPLAGEQHGLFLSAWLTLSDVASVGFAVASNYRLTLGGRATARSDRA